MSTVTPSPVSAYGVRISNINIDGYTINSTTGVSSTANVIFSEIPSNGNLPVALKYTNMTGTNTVNTFDIGYMRSTSNPSISNSGDGILLNAERGYVIGSRWINTLTGVEYECVDNTIGSSIWVQRTENLFKNDVRIVTISALPSYTFTTTTPNSYGKITFDVNGVQTIDGITLNTNDRILVTTGISAAHNGIYVVLSSGSISSPCILIRSPDARLGLVPNSTPLKNAIIKGNFVNIISGTKAGSSYQLISFDAPSVLNTTDQTWAEMGTGGGGGGGGITLITNGAGINVTDGSGPTTVITNTGVRALTDQTTANSTTTFSLISSGMPVGGGAVTLKTLKGSGNVTLSQDANSVTIDVTTVPPSAAVTSLTPSAADGGSGASQVFSSIKTGGPTGIITLRSFSNAGNVRASEVTSGQLQFDINSIPTTMAVTDLAQTAGGNFTLTTGSATKGNLTLRSLSNLGNVQISETTPGSGLLKFDVSIAAAVTSLTSTGGTFSSINSGGPTGVVTLRSFSNAGNVQISETAPSSGILKFDLPTTAAVTSAIGGLGIMVSSATGAVTFTNIGVRGVVDKTAADDIITYSLIKDTVPVGGGSVTLKTLKAATTAITLVEDTVDNSIKIGLGTIPTTAAVTSAIASTGINVSSNKGDVTFTNTGVTSAIQGAGISVSGGTGAVTITNTGIHSVTSSTGPSAGSRVAAIYDNTISNIASIKYLSMGSNMKNVDISTTPGAVIINSKGVAASILNTGILVDNTDPDNFIVRNNGVVGISDNPTNPGVSLAKSLPTAGGNLVLRTISNSGVITAAPDVDGNLVFSYTLAGGPVASIQGINGGGIETSNDGSSWSDTAIRNGTVYLRSNGVVLVSDSTGGTGTILPIRLSQSAGTVTLYRLKEGSGISLSQDIPNGLITIANSGIATLRDNTTGGVSLFDTQSGVATGIKVLRKIMGGTGINVTANTNPDSELITISPNYAAGISGTPLNLNSNSGNTGDTNIGAVTGAGNVVIGSSGAGTLTINNNTILGTGVTFTVGTGLTTLGGGLTATAGTTSLGITNIGGNTAVTGTSTFTVGTGLTTLGGGLTVTGSSSLSGDTININSAGASASTNINAGSGNNGAVNIGNRSTVASTAVTTAAITIATSGTTTIGGAFGATAGAAIDIGCGGTGTGATSQIRIGVPTATTTTTGSTITIGGVAGAAASSTINIGSADVAGTSTSMGIINIGARSVAGSAFIGQINIGTGTSPSAINIGNANSGTISLFSATNTININSAASAGNTNIGSVSNNLVTIGSTSSTTGGNGVTLLSGSAGIRINSVTGSGPVTIGGADIGTISIGNGTTTTNDSMINIGTGGVNAAGKKKSINIGHIATAAATNPYDTPSQTNIYGDVAFSGGTVTGIAAVSPSFNGAVQINNNQGALLSTTQIGTGTTTGFVNIGKGDSTQTIEIATGVTTAVRKTLIIGHTDSGNGACNISVVGDFKVNGLIELNCLTGAGTTSIGNVASASNSINIGSDTKSGTTNKATIRIGHGVNNGIDTNRSLTTINGDVAFGTGLNAGTVTGLVTGTSATLNGTININVNQGISVTQIGTGTTTGDVNIGGSNAVNILGAVDINRTNTLSTRIGNATGTITLAGAVTSGGSFAANNGLTATGTVNINTASGDTGSIAIGGGTNNAGNTVGSSIWIGSGALTSGAKSINIGTGSITAGTRTINIGHAGTTVPSITPASSTTFAGSVTLGNNVQAFTMASSEGITLNSGNISGAGQISAIQFNGSLNGNANSATNATNATNATTAEELSTTAAAITINGTSANFGATSTLSAAGTVNFTGVTTATNVVTSIAAAVPSAPITFGAPTTPISLIHGTATNGVVKIRQLRAGSGITLTPVTGTNSETAVEISSSGITSLDGDPFNINVINGITTRNTNINTGTASGSVHIGRYAVTLNAGESNSRIRLATDDVVEINNQSGCGNVLVGTGAETQNVEIRAGLTIINDTTSNTTAVKIGVGNMTSSASKTIEIGTGSLDATSSRAIYIGHGIGTGAIASTTTIRGGFSVEGGSVTISTQGTAVNTLPVDSSCGISGDDRFQTVSIGAGTVTTAAGTLALTSGEAIAKIINVGTGGADLTATGAVPAYKQINIGHAAVGSGTTSNTIFAGRVNFISGATVDFNNGATVDFTGATVTGLSASPTLVNNPININVGQTSFITNIGTAETGATNSIVRIGGRAATATVVAGNNTSSVTVNAHDVILGDPTSGNRGIAIGNGGTLSNRIFGYTIFNNQIDINAPGTLNAFCNVSIGDATTTTVKISSNATSRKGVALVADSTTVTNLSAGSVGGNVLCVAGAAHGGFNRCFVWAGSTAGGTTTTATADDQVVFRTVGGFNVYTTNAANDKTAGIEISSTALTVINGAVTSGSTNAVSVLGGNRTVNINSTGAEATAYTTNIGNTTSTLPSGSSALNGVNIGNAFTGTVSTGPVSSTSRSAGTVRISCGATVGVSADGACGIVQIAVPQCSTPQPIAMTAGSVRIGGTGTGTDNTPGASIAIACAQGSATGLVGAVEIGTCIVSTTGANTIAIGKGAFVGTSYAIEIGTVSSPPSNTSVGKSITIGHAAFGTTLGTPSTTTINGILNLGTAVQAYTATGLITASGGLSATGNVSLGTAVQAYTATGLITASGGLSVAGTTNINNTGTAATNIGTSATADTVTIGRPGGTISLASAVNFNNVASSNFNPGTLSALTVAGTTDINIAGNASTNIGTSTGTGTVTIAPTQILYLGTASSIPASRTNGLYIGNSTGDYDFRILGGYRGVSINADTYARDGRTNNAAQSGATNSTMIGSGALALSGTCTGNTLIGGNQTIGTTQLPLVTTGNGNTFIGVDLLCSVTNCNRSVVLAASHSNINGTATTQLNVIGGKGATVANTHDNCFVWSSTSATSAVDLTTSTGSNSVVFRASGGFTIYSDAAGVTNYVSLPSGGSAGWSFGSDINVKKNIVLLDTRKTLDSLSKVPISSWQYITSADDSVKNVGPMAQDWQAQFDFGNKELSLATNELVGIALASIQGLNLKLEDKAGELSAENVALQARLTTAEAQLATQAAQLAVQAERISTTEVQLASQAAQLAAQATQIAELIAAVAAMRA